MEPLLDDGTGPLEYLRDSVCVDAPNKRAAKVSAVPRLRELRNGYLDGRDGSPFSGLLVLPGRCPHGKLLCDEHAIEDYCLICAAEEDKDHPALCEYCFCEIEPGVRHDCDALGQSWTP
jgi:hypothetical protein